MWPSADVRNIFFVVASVRAECGMTSAVFHGPRNVHGTERHLHGLTNQQLTDQQKTEDGMNWDHIEDNWKQFSATVKEKWDKLSEEEIAELKGKRDQLEAKIQQVYGHAKDQVKKDVDEWFTTLKGVMNWDHIEGDWKRFSGAIKEKWDKLTEEEIAELKGKRDQLEAKIQQVYGHARDQVKKDVDEWVRELARRI
jgi:uncharacterized protein YjbJ (UPF0337 family)